MKVSYNGLWQILIDKSMNKKDLQDQVGLASSTIAKMGKGELVSLDVLYRIAIALDVDFADLISVGRPDKAMKLKGQDCRVSIWVRSQA